MKDGRLAAAVFAALVVATVGAFYLTQHLKTKNPLIQGGPRADPAVINPQYAGTCTDLQGTRTSFRATTIGFYLQSRPDTALVSITNSEGQVVATAHGSGRHLSINMPPVYSYYGWDGRENAPGFDDQYAPAGTYGFRVALLNEGRTFPVSNNGVPTTVQLLRGRPVPRILTITNQSNGQAGAAGFTPGQQSVKIRWKRPADPYAAVDVLIYRSPANPIKPLTLVGTIHASPRAGSAVWHGTIDGRPAPAGSYLVGLRVKDQACVTATVPTSRHPVAGAYPGAGVGVAYLTARPQQNVTSAGQVAGIQVYSAGEPYAWALRLNGAAKVIAHGHAPGSDGKVPLHLRLPTEGLYALTLRTASRSLTIPLVASHAHGGAKVLVVLPTLSWQGTNPVDDDGDGVIDTLAHGSITLSRPLVNGLPHQFADQAALLKYLVSQGDRFQLTTDVALAEGAGPSLQGYRGVILDGQFSWLATNLVSRLQGFVKNGGAVFNDGVNSLQATAPVSGSGNQATAGPTTRHEKDLFGVSHGPLGGSGGLLIANQGSDPLNIFGAGLELQYPSYQPLIPPTTKASVAGVSTNSPAIVGFRRGSGSVVEVALPNFGLDLAGDPSAQTFLNQVWKSTLNASR